MNSHDRNLAMSREALALLDAELSAGAALTDTFGLTPKEIHVARMIARGQSPNQIAHALGISHHTVRNHLKSIYAKTDTRLQSALAVLIVRMEQRP